MKILKSISILIGLNVFCLNEVILLSSLTLYTFLKMIHHFRSINRHMGKNRKIKRYIYKMIKKYFQFQVCFQDIYISMAVIFSSTQGIFAFQHKGFSFRLPRVATRYNQPFPSVDSAGFIHRLDSRKPRASKFRGPQAKVYNFFLTLIGLSHLCCHNILYFLNNPSVISEYCRILSTRHHLHLYSN